MKSLRYIPSLNAVTGGVNATLLMGQLEYWFEKVEGKSFYKFTEPCEDRNYQKGDSWCEELGFSKAEFRSAFAKIGKAYKSKKAYLESKDKFGGKFYLSYYDRIKHLTYYVRNEKMLRELYAQINIPAVGKVRLESLSQVEQEEGMQKQIGSSTHERITTVQEAASTICAKTESVFPISVDYSQRLHSVVKESLTHEEVLEMYHSICLSLPPIGQLTPSLREQLNQFIHKLGGERETIQRLFEKVDGSDFLSGRILGKMWKASLNWITKGERYRDILADKYCNRVDELRTKHQTKNSRFHKIASHNWDFNHLELLEQQYIEENLKKFKDSTNPLLSKVRGDLGSAV